MHSNDYSYEGKSMNSYVREVNNFLWRFKTPHLISKADFLCGATSMFKCETCVQFYVLFMSNHFSNYIDSLPQLPRTWTVLLYCSMCRRAPEYANLFMFS